MITEIILVLFAIFYYLFSVIFLASYMRVTSGSIFTFVEFCLALVIMGIAPIATPIILGIELGEWIKNN